MKKLFYTALLIILLVPFQHINAEDFADKDDIFKVVSPAPNSKVGGVINIEWNSYDDDQTAIPYYIELLDGASCNTTSYGRINLDSSSLSSTTANNKINWDTHKTISTQSLNDGNYCLQICSAFKNTDAFYSICNSRNITIVNVNKLPTISSSPTNLTINENEDWQYQVKTSDADNDTLKYYLAYAPDFIQINSATGVISTKSGAKRIADGENTAEYRVVVGVDDGISGTTSQEFTIRVERGRNPNTPSNNNGGTVTPPQNTPSQISFTSPKENAQLAGPQNFVEWSIYDPDGIKQVVLSYSKDLENWTELISSNEETFSRYSWDVSSLEDGKYYLQLKITDKKDEVIAKTSKSFNIKNVVDTPVAKPLIINVKPENTKNLTESPTVITGDFAVSENQQLNLDSFKLKVNDTDLSSDCVKNTGGFQCNVKSALTEGDYKITAEIKDQNGNTGNFESSFSIIKKIIAPTASTTDNSAAIILVVIILLLIILVGLPWFFIGYSKRRNTKAKIKQSTVVNIDSEPLPKLRDIYTPNYQPITPQPAISQPAAAPQPQIDNSKSFSDFMTNYNFTEPEPKLGEVKQQSQKVEPKQNTIGNTFKDIAKKVSSFTAAPKQTPKPAAPQSAPVNLNQNPNLGQNIQMAYSGGTSTKSEETFVEPTVIDNQTAIQNPMPVVQPPIQQIPSDVVVPGVAQADEYATPAISDQSEEELRKMYPELYGQPQPTTPEATDEFFEPKPKD